MLLSISQSQRGLIDALVLCFASWVKPDCQSLSSCTSPPLWRNSRWSIPSMWESQSMNGRPPINQSVQNWFPIQKSIIFFYSILHVDFRSKNESRFMSQVYLDGSTVGKKATEILWLWSPDLQIGGWAPPQVHPSDRVNQRIRMSISHMSHCTPARETQRNYGPRWVCFCSQIVFFIYGEMSIYKSFNVDSDYHLTHWNGWCMSCYKLHSWLYCFSDSGQWHAVGVLRLWCQKRHHGLNHQSYQ